MFRTLSPYSFDRLLVLSVLSLTALSRLIEQSIELRSQTCLLWVLHLIVTLRKHNTGRDGLRDDRLHKTHWLQPGLEGWQMFDRARILFSSSAMHLMRKVTLARQQLCCRLKRLLEMPLHPIFQHARFLRPCKVHKHTCIGHDHHSIRILLIPYPKFRHILLNIEQSVKCAVCTRWRKRAPTQWWISSGPGDRVTNFSRRRAFNRILCPTSYT